MKNKIFHILTFLKSGCTFQPMENHHPVSQVFASMYIYVLVCTCANLITTAARMIEWFHSLEVSVMDNLRTIWGGDMISDTVIYKLLIRSKIHQQQNYKMNENCLEEKITEIRRKPNFGQFHIFNALTAWRFIWYWETNTSSNSELKHN